MADLTSDADRILDLGRRARERDVAAVAELVAIAVRPERGRLALAACVVLFGAGEAIAALEDAGHTLRLERIDVATLLADSTIDARARFDAARIMVDAVYGPALVADDDGPYASARAEADRSEA